MVRRILQVVAIAALLGMTILAHAQKPSASTSSQKLVVVGGSVFMPLMKDIAERFESRYPGTRIEFRWTGAAEGLATLRKGSADIAMLQRALHNRERDLFGYPIARDGVAIVVNRDNPVKNVTAKDFTSILVGRITNWKPVGGRDAPIKLAWRTGEGSTYFILEYLKLKREQIGPNMAVANNDDAITFAASDPNGVALASVAIAERRMKGGAAIKMLAFDGLTAASRTIQSHEYPLSRPLLLATASLAEGRQKQFIEYSASPQVLDLHLKHGFVPYRE